MYRNNQAKRTRYGGGDENEDRKGARKLKRGSKRDKRHRSTKRLQHFQL